MRSGLLVWAEDGSAIEIPSKPDGLSLDPGGSVDDSLPGQSGILTIPRRILRFLARGARPALIATALAALLRCLSRRKAGWGPRGRLKASWVAEVFGVDVRRVKAARAELIAMGWMTAEGDAQDQWSWNRWGRAYRLDLGWSPSVANRHPSGGETGVELPPLDLDPDPVPEESNPDPEPAGPTGDWLRRDGEEAPSLPEPSVPPTLPRPMLRDIRPEDLDCTARTLALHRQAVAAGWSSPSEADRLRFVAAASHVRSFPAVNPAGLFRAIVEGRRWGLITQKDEDRARGRLRALASSGSGSSMASPTAPQPTALGLPSAMASILARLGCAPPSSSSSASASPGRR